MEPADGRSVETKEDAMTATHPTELEGTWTVDTVHSGLEFSARHAMIATVRGRFKLYEGTLTLDPADPSRSSVQVTIDAASIDTGNEQRDAHLRSPDFLDVERFPRLTFTSKRIEHKGDDDFTVWGDLTIRDVTREIELPVTFNGLAVDPMGNQRAGFDGETTIDRKAWGLNWNAPLEAGGILVGDKVRLHLSVSAIKQG
jgi:polyisoprenoid-binding protein YceI